jgi:5,10-methylenetetrahydromethanopterin reductase
MGLGAIPLAAMERYIGEVQGLLRGETIDWRFEGQRRKIAFLNPDFGLINLGDPIGLHVSAMGPKARRLTAKLGAGWLNFGGDVWRATRELEDMKSAWSEAGSKTPLYSTLFSLGCVLLPGERADSERAMAQAGPQAAVMFHNLAELGSDGSGLPPPMAQALRRYREVYSRYTPEDARYLQNHRGHLMFLRPEERSILSAEIVDALSFTAAKEELRDRLRALERAGYSQFAIQIVEHHEDALEEWARVFELV